MRFLLLFLLISTAWALTIEEKIGQMVLIPAWATGNEGDFEALEARIEKWHAGGVLWLTGNEAVQKAWVARLREAIDWPLLMAQDLEWGLSFRFPHLAAGIKPPQIESEMQAELIGRQIAAQCHDVGIDFNLAPVLDLAGNPRIGERSYGAKPDRVAQIGLAVARGLQQGGVVPCAKHYPGHGATQIDTHFDLPSIELSDEHLQPFQLAVASGLPCIMVGHLHVSVWGDKPASLSPYAIASLREMGFNGVIATDALNMGALSRYPHPEVLAVQAGCDLILWPSDMSALHEAVQTGLISEEQIDASLARLKVLREYSAHIQRAAAVLRPPEEYLALR